LNLQAANVVINLDLPWNPARLEQRIARAWRKHQTRPVQVLHLVTENSIEHRMIPLLAGKQALADGVIDGLGDLSAMPLPSGRKALVERLEALMGRTEPLPAPADAPSPPALEVIDRATLEAIERLVQAGVLQLAPGASLPLRSPVLDRAREVEDAERARRLARARELLEQAERKIRMSTVLAAGGFPLEALPALREGVDLGVRSWAALQGAELTEQDGDSLAWGEAHLPRPFPLLGKLRSGPAALLGVEESEVRSWIEEGGRWVEGLRMELGG
jgi:hypothetical protein